MMGADRALLRKADRMTNKSPAIELAKQERNEDKNILTLSSGVKVRIKPVSGWLIDDVVNRVKNPRIPTWYNPDREREEDNPNDPQYLADMSDARDQRMNAMLDTVVLFGMELVDGMPEDEGWLHKLQRLEKLGHIDLSAYDLDDEVDREFVYKRRFAISNATDLITVRQRCSVSEGDVAKATDSFPGDGEGNADS